MRRPPSLTRPWYHTPTLRSRVCVCHQKTHKNKTNPDQSQNQAHNYCWARLPRPTAPPSRPNCRPSPVRVLAAGTGAGASLTGTGGGRPAASFPFLTSGPPWFTCRSPNPNVEWSSMSPPIRCSRLARSWTDRNFSSSSVQRMMPSSRPFSLLGRSKLEALGVVAFLNKECQSSGLVHADKGNGPLGYTYDRGAICRYPIELTLLSRFLSAAKADD